MRISRKTTQNINRDQLFKIEELWDWTNSAKTENIVYWVVGQVVQKSAAQGQKGAWIEDICTFIVEQFEKINQRNSNSRPSSMNKKFHI